MTATMTNLRLGPEVDSCNDCTREFGNEVRGPNGEQPVLDLDYKEGACDMCGWRGHDSRYVAHGVDHGYEHHMIVCEDCAADIEARQVEERQELEHVQHTDWCMAGAG